MEAADDIVITRLDELGVFDSASIKLNVGSPELPGTKNVVIKVVENQEVNSPSAEGSLKLKNMFGYRDIWDTCFTYNLDQTSELSAGVSLPISKKLCIPTMARVSLLTQDWLSFNFYKGLSLGLLSTENHEYTYNLSWRTLTDLSEMSSGLVRRRFGLGFLSAPKYRFKIDRRDSSIRPTRGFAFVSTSQMGVVLPDFLSISFVRQELDLRLAIPLGFQNAALNFGIFGGFLMQWGSRSLERTSSLPDRFYLGGNSSPNCSVVNTTSLLGFESRGVGPAQPGRSEESSGISEMDLIRGDIAVTVFADLSFDLPFRFLRENGVHAHAFACGGILSKFSETASPDFSFPKFLDYIRGSAGFGIVLPLKPLRVEVNYCYIVKQHEHDKGKTGFQLSFSAPL